MAEVDALLERPLHLDIIECGPGKGTLAHDLLDELSATSADLYSRVRYWLVEISPVLAQAQRDALLPAHAGVAKWCDSLQELPPGLQGAVIANELIDAFPVHVLENRAGDILEEFVTINGTDELALVLLPVSDTRLQAFLNLKESCYSQGSVLR